MNLSSNNITIVIIIDIVVIVGIPIVVNIKRTNDIQQSR